MPVRKEIDLNRERAVLADPTAREGARRQAADEIAWIDRINAGKKISLSALHLGPTVLLHMPGELFVEYQLAAQTMSPSETVCMAAYGDYGPGYIGTAKSYPEGGYETALYVSRTAPEVEGNLLDAIESLLE